MKISFIGYGNMARALSGRWTATHEVFIGGRNIERAAQLCDEVKGVASGSIAEALRFGEVVVLVTPAGAVEDAIAKGGEPVDVGELKYARLLEASAGLVIKFLFSGRDMRTVLNLIQPESKPID